MTWEQFALTFAGGWVTGFICHKLLDWLLDKIAMKGDWVKKGDSL